MIEEYRWYLYDANSLEYLYTYSTDEVQPENSTPIMPPEDLMSPIYWENGTWVSRYEG